MEKNFKIVLFVALILPLIASAGIFYGYLSAPDGTVFSGIDFGQDQLFYGSFIKESSNTLSPLQSNRFTTDFGMSGGGFFNVLFLILGVITKLTGISVALVLLIYRILIEFIFFIILWFFLCKIFQEEKKRIFSFFVCAIGGGIGGFVSIASLVIPEAKRLMASDISYWLGFSTFGELFNVLFFSGMTLLLLTILLVFEFHKNRKISTLALIALIEILAYAVHPVSFVIICIILIFEPIFIFFTTLSFKNALKNSYPALVTIFCAGLITGVIFILGSDQGFAFVISKYLTGFQRTTSAFWYPVGYGFVLLLALYGFFNNKIAEQKKHLILAWFSIMLILALNPWKGIRFHPYLHVPLVIIATEGFFTTLPKIKSFFVILKTNLDQNQLIALSIAIISISAPFIAYNHFQYTFTQDIKSPFIQDTLIESFNFLDLKTVGTLFADENICSLAPIYTPHYCYLGNWSVTPNNNEKIEEVNKIMNCDEQCKSKFFEEKKFNYLLVESGIDFSKYGYVLEHTNKNYSVWVRK